MSIESSLPPEFRSGIVIVADGGCKGNGATDAKMDGSYLLFKDGKHMPIYHNDILTHHVHLAFGDKPVNTSPVAECLTFLDVLAYVQAFVTRCKSMGLNPPLITVLMDNQMVVNFANQTWQAKEAHMIPLRSEIVTHPALGNVTVKWISNKIVKRILGH